VVTPGTSLNLIAILKSAASRSGMDAPASAVSGLTPAAKALQVAVAAAALPRGVVLYVVPTDRDLEQAASDVSFFLSALEGLSSNAVDRAVLPFPSHEIDPYRGMAPHFGVVSARARALFGIASGTARVIVASAAALTPKVSAPERLLNASIELRPGHDIAPSDLAELFVDAGFNREDPADEHGEFAVRGGIVDVFPANEAFPVRLEFVGDTIESLRTYDAATQRSQHPIDQLTIVPLKDQLDGNLPSTIFDYLSRAKQSRVIVSEPDEVEAQLTRQAEHLQRSYNQAIGAEAAPDEDEDVDWAVEFGADGDDDSYVEAGLQAGPRADAQAAPIRPRGRRGRRNQPRMIDARPPEELFAPIEVVAARLAAGAALSELGIGEDSVPVRCQPAMEFHGRIPDWVGEIRARREEGATTVFVAASQGRAERTIEVLKEYEVLAVPVERADEARYASVLVAIGSLSRGFLLPDAGLQLYAETDIFDEERRTAEKRRSASNAFLSDLRDLKVGDLIVHVDHGIGVFVGLKQLGVGDSMQEFLELRYAGDDKLFVPVERLDLVQKYTGATRPPVDRLGGTSWERAKTRVKKAMRDMAEELLKLYAQRKAVPGHAFGADTHWQQEFEDAFEFELTPDQKTAIADIKSDMESTTPMDRLLCGDVGYGKTEVAMRAAFKAVMDGKQVAVLAPTTVLAFQHEKTLKERFAGFPVKIAMVSRFRSKAEQ
jgi:transcription-repair coupling factor (superfamily II helicase)